MPLPSREEQPVAGNEATKAVGAEKTASLRSPASDAPPPGGLERAAS